MGEYLCGNIYNIIVGGGKVYNESTNDDFWERVHGDSCLGIHFFSRRCCLQLPLSGSLYANTIVAVVVHGIASHLSQ